MTTTSTINDEDELSIDKTAPPTGPTAAAAAASEDSDGPLLISGVSGVPRKDKILYPVRFVPLFLYNILRFELASFLTELSTEYPFKIMIIIINNPPYFAKFEVFFF